VEAGFYDECRFFRVLPDFVAQVGLHGDPSVNLEWKPNPIEDDPVAVSNTRGTVVFATAGPNTRTTQIFINTKEEGNLSLDEKGFAPFGEVIEGMNVIDELYAGYGEGPPSGDTGPVQALIREQGNAYLESSFPMLSYISHVTVAAV
jgi:peptidyl-prolyl cis-trans isomerase A (cyclophilin A)